MTAVWIERARHDLAAAPVLGQGGEATVYDLGDGRALKLFKDGLHPDLAGDAAREAAADARLAELEARLRERPRPLPAAVVEPRELARGHAGARAPVVGYVMTKVAGTPLYQLGEPRVRRAGGLDLGHLVAALRELHGAVAGVHAAGAVLGDFNDGNVLVDGARVHLLDADSFQYGRWTCPLYTERFVDPRLCTRPAPAPVLSRPHDRDSDWYAFATMVFRTLLWVGPYGGVHAPADPRRRVAPAARCLEGPPVFAADVTWPRAAVPFAALSDELADHFTAVYARGARGPFPAALLDRLHLTRCASCAIDHGRVRCPLCSVAVQVPVAVTGALTVRPLAAAPAVHAWPVGRAPQPGAPAVWMASGALWRQGALGAEAIGQVVAGETVAWTGARTGAGWYRAGGYAVGFTFSPARRGLDDRARLPAMRGAILDRGCVLGDDRAWLWWREALAGREHVTVAVIAGGRLLATATAPADDLDWMAGLGGACAAGPHLLVPTDAGVVRVELERGALVVGRRFPDTAPLVTAADDLTVVADGLAVSKATRLVLPGAAAPVHHLVLSFTSPSA